MFFKELSKFALLIGVAVLSVLYILNADQIDSLFNTYLDQPINIVITDINPNSFTVTWSSLAPDYGAILLSDDSEITEYEYSDSTYDLFLDSRELSANNISDMEIAYTHIVTVDNLTPGEDYYFALTNGTKVWGSDYIAMTSDNIDIASDSLYVRLPSEIDSVDSPRPLVGSVVSGIDSVSTDELGQTVVVLHGRNSGYKRSVSVDSDGHWITDISMYEDNEILDIYYYLSNGDYSYSNSLISDLSFNSRGYFYIEETISSQIRDIISEVAAQESVGYCCAYLVDDHSQFYGSYSDSLCDDEAYQIQSVNSERLCNNTFDGVCCDIGDGSREWLPRISCATENRIGEYSSPDTCDYVPNTEYSIQLAMSEGVNVLDTNEYIPIGTSGDYMRAAGFLTVGGSGYVTYITQYENYQWKILLRLDDGSVVGKDFDLDKYMGYVFYSTDMAVYKISAYKREIVIDETLYKISSWNALSSIDTYESGSIYYIDSSSIKRDSVDFGESEIKGILQIK